MDSKNKYALEQATVVLFNPLSQMRATLRDAMLVLGFRHIYDFSDLERARNAIVEQTPDLVLLDLDREKDAVCNLVHEVRHSRMASDPFMVICALSWNPSVEAVNTSLEAGVDDIITMPISIKLLSERIDMLIRSRKNFVVTSSYVGPDRRANSRITDDPLGLGTIQVPNNLRYKATGDTKAIASSDAISKVQDRINNHRVNRYAQRVAWLVDEMVRDLSEGKDKETIRRERNNELASLIENLAVDLQLQGYGDLLDITDSMSNVLENIVATPTKQFYELLKVHALAITATLLEKEGAAELVIQALNDATAKLSRSKIA